MADAGDGGPYFELHIRPMFRRLDRDHMLGSLDLWNYEQVSAKAQQVAAFLRRPPPQTMPTVRTGGPWPEGWIAVFEEWLVRGCPRLLRASGTYAAHRLGNRWSMLSVQVELGDRNDRVWVEREESPADVAAYTLYLRPAPAGSTAPEGRIELTELIMDANVTTVWLTDADGLHEIPVQESPRRLV